MSATGSSDDESSSNDSIKYVDFIGKTIENYLFLTKIGNGVSSNVYIAFNLINNCFFAIKVINPDDIEIGESELEILLKVRKLHNTNFSNIVSHFQYKYDDDTYLCMVFELMACSLYDIIKQSIYSDDSEYDYKLNFNDVKLIIEQISNAISSLHKIKIMHTDIKPENILIAGTSEKIEKIKQDFMNKYKKLNKKQKTRGAKQPLSRRSDCNDETKSNLEKVVKLLFEHHEPNDSYSSGEDEQDDELHLWESDTDSDNIKTVINDKLKYKIIITRPCNVQLTDFGNSINFKDMTVKEIQTRYYRAPEVIMKIPYTEQADLWSVGCLYYEILTGYILFHPSKSKGFNRNRQHIYLIQKLLGRIPNELLVNSKRKHVIYKTNGLIKGAPDAKYIPLDIYLNDKLSNITIDKKYFIDKICNLLKYNPEERQLT